MRPHAPSAWRSLEIYVALRRRPSATPRGASRYSGRPHALARVAEILGVRGKLSPAQFGVIRCSMNATWYKTGSVPFAPFNNSPALTDFHALRNGPVHKIGDMILHGQNELFEGARIYSRYAYSPVFSYFALDKAGRDQVSFIENRYGGLCVQFQLCQGPFHRDHLLFKLLVAYIDYMKQQIGVQQFFQGGRKSFQQVFWQIPYESDSVGYYDLEVSWEPKPAADRVQRGKQLVFDENRAVGQRIEQGGFTCVGVSHN